MIFLELDLAGAFLVEPERLEDGRGFFARTWCRREFEARGLDPRLAQCSVSFNARRGTLRGMHYQAAPHAEAKLVRCTRGAVFDVVLDLRPGSPTFARWASSELTADDHRMLYVPAGFAHGFQTLADRTEVFYQMSEPFEPSSARGVRWDDPAFGIAWPPAADRVISERDRGFPDFG
ncbi:MAG: dTDP-4-dehydrorhamnose 3,5-epimerase [Planctomycetia bacterium]|nr:dTDP-4-dehydrorhamnose 3,5-epimerase [Planctomycetia bacterium]